MHVQHPLRPGALMQVVDILGDDQQLARPCGIETRQRAVRRIGLDRRQCRTASVVETVDKIGILRARVGRAHILDAVPFPQPARPAKSGKAALGGDAGAGQDDDVVELHDLPNIAPTRRRKWPADGRATARCRTRSTTR